MASDFAVVGTVGTNNPTTRPCYDDGDFFRWSVLSLSSRRPSSAMMERDARAYYVVVNCYFDHLDYLFDWLPPLGPSAAHIKQQRLW